MKLPITVITNTINAEGHLEEYFDSVLPYVEDVFIVDSRSTDKTVDICLGKGVKIVQRPFLRPSDQCAWELSKLPIKTPWVLILAQDERLSKSLVEELSTIFDAGISEEVDCFTFQWRLWFMGKPLHAKSTVYRLFRTGHCHVSDVACDEHFYSDGVVRHLKGIIEHKDTLNLHEWYEKQNLWTTLGAVGRIKDNCEAEKSSLFGTWLQRKMFLKRLVNRLPVFGKLIKFLHYYVGFGAWRDGYEGWQWARLRMWVQSVVDLKEREFRKHGIPKVLPKARHGDFDPRILATELQQKLLPETIIQ